VCVYNKKKKKREFHLDGEYIPDLNRATGCNNVVKRMIILKAASLKSC
jgi:hypothetical protein